MRRMWGVTMSIGALALLSACASIHIQTGPAGEEDAAQSSELRGKGLRGEFKNRLDQAGPLEKVEMWSAFVDSVTIRYLRFGADIADQWRKASEAKGHDVKAEEIRLAVSNSTASDRPMLNSYDDIVDYGLAEIQHTSFVDKTTEQLLTELRDHYFDVGGFVFLPSGTRVEYEDKLARLKTDTDELASQVDRDIRRYR